MATGTHTSAAGTTNCAASRRSGTGTGTGIAVTMPGTGAATTTDIAAPAIAEAHAIVEDQPVPRSAAPPSAAGWVVRCPSGTRSGNCIISTAAPSAPAVSASGGSVGWTKMQ